MVAPGQPSHRPNCAESGRPGRFDAARERLIASGRSTGRAGASTGAPARFRSTTCASAASKHWRSTGCWRASAAPFHPLRPALTGQDKGPEMARLLPPIGKARAEARLRGNSA
jgi:hypothetical protein